MRTHNDFKISVMDIEVFGLGEESKPTTLCLNNCSFPNGRCVATLDSKCVCGNGFAGKDCSVRSCGGCNSGTCHDGVCTCSPGQFGANCERKTPCPNNCWGHGVCESGAQCNCGQGFDGIDCRYRLVLNGTLRVLHLDEFVEPSWPAPHPHYIEALNLSTIAGCSKDRPVPCTTAPLCGISAGECTGLATQSGSGSSSHASAYDDQRPWVKSPEGASRAVRAWSQLVGQGRNLRPPLSAAGATATSKYPWPAKGHLPSNAIDSDHTTSWRSVSTSEERWENITVDLGKGKAVTISVIHLDAHATVGHDNGAKNDMGAEVAAQLVDTFCECSSDQVAWTVVHDKIPSLYVEESI